MLLTILCLCLTTKTVHFYTFSLPKFGQIDMSADSFLKCPILFYLLYLLCIILAIGCPHLEGWVAVSMGRPTVIPAIVLRLIIDWYINRAVAGHRRSFSSMQKWRLPNIHNKINMFYLEMVEKILYVFNMFCMKFHQY